MLWAAGEGRSCPTTFCHKAGLRNSQISLKCGRMSVVSSSKLLVVVSQSESFIMRGFKPTTTGQGQGHSFGFEWGMGEVKRFGMGRGEKGRVKGQG